MKKFSIKCTDCNAEEAMTKIEELNNVDRKEQNCLRLLTEEMFSAMKNVLEDKEATFSIAKEDDVWTLQMDVNANINPQAREDFLSLSTSGQNMAYQGLKGLLKEFLEVMARADVGMCMASGLDTGYVDNIQFWQMNQFLRSLSENDKKNAWDGLEKSIIANFADDVLVGVTDYGVKIIVKYSGK